MEINKLIKIVKKNETLFKPYFSDLGITLCSGLIDDRNVLFIYSNKERADKKTCQKIKKLLKVKDVELINIHEGKPFWSIVLR